MNFERSCSFISSIRAVSSYWNAFFIPPVKPYSPASERGTIADIRSSFSESDLSLRDRIFQAISSLSTNYSSISCSNTLSLSFCLSVSLSLICVIFYSSISTSSNSSLFYAFLIADSLYSKSQRAIFSFSSGINESPDTIYSSICCNLSFAPNCVKNVLSSSFFFPLWGLLKGFFWNPFFDYADDFQPVSDFWDYERI